MDAEHDACVDALAVLADRRDLPSVEAVLAAYRSHFAHEEALLDEHLYASVAAPAGASPPAPPTGFSLAASARKSHFADHARMLAALEAMASSLRASGGRADTKLVNAALRDFEAHADKYDGAYADPLSQALAAAEVATELE